MMVERPTPGGLQEFNIGYSHFDDLTSWTWDVPAGQPMLIRVYTRGDSVTLLLNGRKLESRARCPTPTSGSPSSRYPMRRAN